MRERQWPARTQRQAAKERAGGAAAVSSQVKLESLMPSDCCMCPSPCRLQDAPSMDSLKLQLKYSNGRVLTTTEAKVADAINSAIEIAGSGKGISNAVLSGEQFQFVRLTT